PSLVVPLISTYSVPASAWIHCSPQPFTSARSFFCTSASHGETQSRAVMMMPTLLLLVSLSSMQLHFTGALLSLAQPKLAGTLNEKPRPSRFFIGYVDSPWANFAQFAGQVPGFGGSLPGLTCAGARDDSTGEGEAEVGAADGVRVPVVAGALGVGPADGVESLDIRTITVVPPTSRKQSRIATYATMTPGDVFFGGGG